MEEDDDQRELQLLPATSSTHRSGRVADHSRRLQATAEPSLDLQLSISIGSLRPSLDCIGETNTRTSSSVEAMKQHAADQIRLAASEKAYAERVRELTRREIELAESEFARARHMWERAREEVEKAERMKEKAVRRIGSTCTEITCQACRQRFRP